MKLKIQFFAALRERMGRSELWLEDVPTGTDMAGLKRLLGERHPEVGALEHVAGVVGTEYVADERVLSEGDEVALLPPVSGGQEGASGGRGAAPDEGGGGDGGTGFDYEAGVFELSEDPIDPGALGARVGHPSCGAILTFTGTTRDENRGQSVERLDYEAFAAMTGPEMARIFDDCRREHAEGGAARLRMLCVHRVGTVGVGEPSVVIAVASPHRDAAFRAARFLIDTLKERLPVWKKEIYAGGHHWINDRS